MLRQTLTLAVAAAVALAACGSPEADEEAEDRAFPAAAVAAWLEAVDAGDVERIDGVVAATGMAVVVAVENGFDAAQTIEVLDDGLPAPLASGYWDSFSRDFADFSGRALSGLTVGDFEELSGGEFAIVDLGQERGSSDVVVARTDDGWRVDMVATLGAGLVAPLSRFFAALPETEVGDEVRTAIRDEVVPSLRVVADRTSEPSLAADTERLIVEIESYIP